MVSKKVSMKDISAACGVSISTVSKSLSNRDDIGEETKEHIRTIAKEMGYFPNSSARALKTNRSYDLGVLFVDEAQSGLTHDYFASVLDSFKVTAEERGYDITFINCNKARVGSMSYLEHSKYRGVDGVVIACVKFDDPEVIELIQSDLPVVTIDHVFNDRMAIQSNNIKGMQDLVTYIHSQGHRRIAYIHGRDSAVTRARLTSFYKTADELGIEVPQEYVIEGDYRKLTNAVEFTNQLLELEIPPTCIIYPDDFAAIGGMNAIKNKKLNIPEDISIAGYDGINIAAQIEPQLTTIQQGTKEMGRLAADRLIDLIERPRCTLVEYIVVEGNLLEGKSVHKIS